ncbi:MAG: MerR family transcriptional regulator [Pseudomonadota bacterium]
MEKSPDAFRTISEVADWLDVPTHVLRFWESRFTQIKPVKRAGGRRYYRPNDMALIGGIKRLLHDDGMTIRGVQKLLREKGVKHVAALSQSLDGRAVYDPPGDVIEASAVEVPAAPPVEPPVSPPVDASEDSGAEEVAEAEPADAAEDLEPALPFEAAPSEPEPPKESPVEPVAASIPATPDVPDTDLEDDDISIPAGSGVAVGLRSLDRSRLVEHAVILKTVSDRIAAARAA